MKTMIGRADHFHWLNRRAMLKGMTAGAASGLMPWVSGTAIAQGAGSLLDPVAPDGSPAAAYANHKARINDIARNFALSDPRTDLKTFKDQADEDKTTALIAHFHAVTNDPSFGRPDEDPSAVAAPAALRRLNRGNGLVGTAGASTDRDYDMALRGLMVLAYRYPSLLGAGGVDFILDHLVPDYLVGGHPPDIEVVAFSFLNIKAPETENHLLMIESSRFLVNQLMQDRHPGEKKYDNTANKLKDWLLKYMAVIAQHDFLEFNSRPYARLSLHALLNLHEFSRDATIRTGAQQLLDYSMMKFALSSNRGRRVSPFRRQQYRINHQANEWDYLFDGLGEQVAGFFFAYTGATDVAGNAARFPESLQYQAVLAGTAAYRPPPAAYIVALDRSVPASIHRFYQGNRPKLPESGDIVDSGLEIYHRSPSFLMSAGGSFLNSGYGSDQIGIFAKKAWEQTSRAQASTLIPTKADTAFHDLVRFEAYPDPQGDPIANGQDNREMSHTTAVNTGVGRGLMAGANLRPNDKKTVLEFAAPSSQALTVHNGVPFVAWLDWRLDGTLTIAQVQTTALMGIDGVEGIGQATRLQVAKIGVAGGNPDAPPALASIAGMLVVAWTDPTDHRLALAVYDVATRSLRARTTLADTSDHGPTLAVHDGRLFLGWTGVGDGQLNVAAVTIIGNSNGQLTLGIENKVTLRDTSEGTPALASHNGRLFLAWQGTGENKLNLLISEDGGKSFIGKGTLSEASSHGPSLVSHNNQLFLAWKGKDNKSLNIARVIVLGNTAGQPGIGGTEAKITSKESSDSAPTITSWNGLLVLAWKGQDEMLLNLRVSRDGTFLPWSGWKFADLTNLGFYLAIYRTEAASPPEGKDTPLENLGLVFAAEKADMDRRNIGYDKFCELIKQQNAHLPERLQYAGTYNFLAPDGQKFTIWYQLAGDKYRARVLETSQYIADFTTLPLVSGPYMVAPGGHDGLIEIRHPGCENAPVILDYRDPLNPKRSDDKASCPGPWLDRANALLASATKLESIGRPVDARIARADGLALQAELKALIPAATTPPPASDPVSITLQKLAAIRVDYSVREDQMRDWLGNPLYTPYPAVADALLSAGWHFKAPIYIDVIVGFYEKTRGVTSPRLVKDVRMDVLRASILAASNERYNSTIKTFGSLLQ